MARSTLEDPFRMFRKDVTDWVIRRVHPDGSEEALEWGPPEDDVSFSTWPIHELSHRTVRTRWGTGSYRVYFAGQDETGRRRPRGRTRVITLTPMAGDPAPSGLEPPGTPRVALTVAEAVRAGGNPALADVIERDLTLFGVFLVRRGM